MSSSSDEGPEPQASCESSSDDEEGAQKPKKNITRFTTAFLNAYYNQGMIGSGKQYKHLIKRASNDAGLSTAQVKVCWCRIVLSLSES